MRELSTYESEIANGGFINWNNPFQVRAVASGLEAGAYGGIAGGVAGAIAGPGALVGAAAGAAGGFAAGYIQQSVSDTIALYEYYNG